MTRVTVARAGVVFAALFALVTFAPSPGVAAGDAPQEAEILPKAVIDRVVAPVIEGQWCMGLVVGLVNEKGTQVVGYGRMGESNPAAPTGETVFEIGSATKPFTGTLLADMARRGEVKLDDPVQNYLPASVTVPKSGGAEITLAHLAAHTSGLPRMPDNFAPTDPSNPYASYTVEQMYAFLSSCEPARKPGEGFEYSNFGMGLLGHALALRAGGSYEQLVTERITKPLGMTDTRITLDDALQARLAPGHDADGNPVRNWEIITLAGAGGLRSTANDLLKFVSANLGLTETDLAPAMRDARASRGKVNELFDIGLGWHLGRPHEAVWHNGQTGGYHSFVGFVPARKVGVIVLANTGSVVPDGVGMSLTKLLLGEPDEPMKLRTGVEIGPKNLDEYVGDFPLAPAFVLTITRDGDRLFCQATGQERFRIYPFSETEFFYKVVDAHITFERGPDGKVSGLVLHQNGMDVPGPKRE